jgi:K+:H+ antiporter
MLAIESLSIESVALIFSACAVVAILSLWLRQSVVVGYLLAGVLLGPKAFNFASEAQVEQLGELGVIFLLFLLGTELSPERIRPLARPALIGGSLEIVLMIVATLGVMTLQGWGWFQGVFLGCVLAHNSTAILVKLLEATDGMRAPHGKFALSISLFQDLAIVPMMVILPELAKGVDDRGSLAANLAIAIAKAGAFLALSFAAGRWIFPPFLARVAAAKSQELFTLTVLALALGLASISQIRFFNLSPAMGAFVAGLALGRSPFSQKVFADVLPFRDAFLAMFFVSVGMILDWRAAAANIHIILPVVGLILVLKTLVSGGVGWFLGLPAGMALQAGLVLSQVGEFSFLLAQMGKKDHIIDERLYQIIITSSVVTMALTPVLSRLGTAVSSWGASLRPLRGMAAGLVDQKEKDLADHIIICGFGPVGKMVATILHGIDRPFLVLELNPETVARAQHEGVPVLYGDARSEVLLEKAGIGRAKGVVVALPNVDIAEGVVRNVRLRHRAIPILARAVFSPHVERLRNAGATAVIHDEREAGRAIARAVLSIEGIKEELEAQLEMLDRKE